MIHTFLDNVHHKENYPYKLIGIKIQNILELDAINIGKDK